MKNLIAVLALAMCVIQGPAIAAEPVSAEKVKELKEKCAKGDPYACTELEFISD